MKIQTCFSFVFSDMIVEPDRKTRQRKNVSAAALFCFVGGDILLAAFVRIAFCFVFCCKEECHTKHSYESE